ncbi:MAG TPA: DUF3300 domain-containing protein [Burkholderiales bacterium]|nr:DUF3300 domain-containing protein [Burkholderiales bacterium]
MHGRFTRKLVWALALIPLCPPYALAQEPAAGPILAYLPPPSAAVQETFSQQELDRLVAPIALYPDALLAQVLMASTYPVDVVEAARWVRAHPEIKGDALQDALQEQNWDPSVKGLVVVPQVLTMMDEKLDWTEKLGDAFLAQQQVVMDTVQSLRARAQAAGNLTSTPQHNVIAEGTTIRIEPASPEVIYVPMYNPAVIYGPWWWPTPPYYWYPPGYVVSGPFVYFGLGVLFGGAIWGACDWGHRRVIVDVHHYNVFNRTRIVSPHWTHDVDHRRGVPYRDAITRRRFAHELPGVEMRREFRGFEPARPHRESVRPSPERIREQLARPAAPPERPQVGERRELLRADSRGRELARTAPSERSLRFGEHREAPRADSRAGGAQPPRSAPRPSASAGTGGGVVFHRPTAPSSPVVSFGERAPPAFETFGRANATRAYADRGAASRADHGAARAGKPRAHREP